jgi:hypothetical protein
MSPSAGESVIGAKAGDALSTASRSPGNIESRRAAIASRDALRQARQNPPRAAGAEKLIRLNLLIISI